jgi:hypothetical protein
VTAGDKEGSPVEGVTAVLRGLLTAVLDAGDVTQKHRAAIGAAVGSVFDRVARGYEYAGAGRNPAKAASLLELRDLLARWKKPRLADDGSVSDGEWSGIERPGTNDCRSPLESLLMSRTAQTRSGDAWISTVV